MAKQQNNSEAGQTEQVASQKRKANKRLCG